MLHGEPARAAAGSVLPAARSSSSDVPPVRIAVYGCDEQEAALFRELAPRFGVVPALTEAPVSEATAGLARGSRCISVGHKARITGSALLALSRVGVTYVSTRSIGCNHIDVEHARRVGITVENVAYSPDSVADYALMSMLMLLRHARSVLGRVQVHDFRLGEAPGRELRDLTVGVVGTGRIGAAVVDRLRGFGSRILAHDIRPEASAEHVSLDELLRQSDIVTLHTPLTAETHHLLSRRRIGAMKRGALVVNTGRGPLLDTDALVSALESGRLGGAALDVLEGEEGVFYTDRRDEPVESELLLRLERLPNVIVTPHIAYYTDHALRDTVESSIVNCSTFERRQQQWVA
jgi:D-specific alpha-keto acid dehydrogenase